MKDHDQEPKKEVIKKGVQGSGAMEIPCIRCKASGNCQTCDGKGEVGKGVIRRTMIICPNCEGERICRFCEGKGFIRSRPERSLPCIECGSEVHIFEWTDRYVDCPNCGHRHPLK